MADWCNMRARLPVRLRQVAAHPLRFTWQVLLRFRANQGLLLASAVAYNALLSIIPMLALFTIALSQIVDPLFVLEATESYLSLIVPNQAELLSQQVGLFLANWKVVGIIGLVVLLFFSSFAFSMLESAFAVIFSHRVEAHGREFWVSALIPYAYILVLGFALVVLTGVSWSLEAMEWRALFSEAEGAAFMLDGQLVVRLLGFAAEVILFTSIYHVMPCGHVPLRHAILGGLTAAVLWELMRRLLVWYFAQISVVNVVYGTFATVIIVLLTMEIAAVILLLGAQVIAEYERIEIEPGPGAD
jgi:YihY family inner membrane protein